MRGRGADLALTRAQKVALRLSGTFKEHDEGWLDGRTASPQQILNLPPSSHRATERQSPVLAACHLVAARTGSGTAFSCSAQLSPTRGGNAGISMEMPALPFHTAPLTWLPWFNEAKTGKIGTCVQPAHQRWASAGGGPSPSFAAPQLRSSAVGRLLPRRPSFSGLPHAARASDVPSVGPPILPRAYACHHSAVVAASPAQEHHAK